MQQIRGSGGIHAPPGKFMTLRLLPVASQMIIRFILHTTIFNNFFLGGGGNPGMTLCNNSCTF